MRGVDNHLGGGYIDFRCKFNRGGDADEWCEILSGNGIMQDDNRGIYISHSISAITATPMEANGFDEEFNTDRTSKQSR